MKLGIHGLALAQKIILGLVLIGSIVLGIYHYTHHGKGSGTVELLAAFLLVLVFLLPPFSNFRYYRLNIFQLGVLAAFDVALLCFAAYHFTQPNQAWRSGTIEIALFALLAFTILFPFRPPPE